MTQRYISPAFLNIFGVDIMKSILSLIPCIQVEHSQITEDLTHPYVTDEPENIKKSITIHSDPYEATSGTHAIVLCTEWDEFKVRLASFTSAACDFLSVHTH